MKKPQSQVKGKQTKQKKQPITLTHASLALNAMLLGSMLVLGAMYSAGSFDMPIINTGIERYCQAVADNKIYAHRSGDDLKQTLAIRDYVCRSDEAAAKYFTDGANAYLKSRNIRPIDNGY